MYVTRLVSIRMIAEKQENGGWKKAVANSAAALLFACQHSQNGNFLSIS